MDVVRVNLERIDDNPFQTREVYRDIPDLAESILQMRKQKPDTSGLIAVPTARLVGAAGQVLIPSEETLSDPRVRVQLAVGHRRERAFRELAREHREYGTFPVFVTLLDDQAMADMAWKENNDRADLSPVEEARAIERAITEFGWTQAQVGQRWSLSQGAVSNKLRLLDLPQKIQAQIRDGEITERHGRALLPLADMGEPLEVYRDVLYLDDGTVAPTSVVGDAVDRYLKANTRNLDTAPWDEDWIANTVESDALACKICSHQVTVGRRHLCLHPQCYDAKLRAHRIEVEGPAKAAEFYETQQDNLRRGDPYGWQPCQGCQRTKDAFYGTEYHGVAWYRGRSYNDWLCPACWEAADLPDVPAEVASATVVYTGADRERPTVPPPSAAARPTAEPTVTIPAPGAAVAVEKRETPSAPVPAPKPEPEPEPERSVLLTARIMPPENGESMPERRVTVSIGENGRGPSGFRQGLLSEMYTMMRDLMRAHYGDKTRLDEEVADGDAL